MVLMQEDKMIAGLVPEEGGGGHVIQDASGTDMTQQPNMQFTDSHVSDDSENEKTVIENIKPLTGAEFDVVTEDGFYAITDEDDATMEEASEDYVEVVGDGVKTYAQLLNELYALIDSDKITNESKLVYNNQTVYSLSGKYSNGYRFGMVYEINSSAFKLQYIYIHSTTSLLTSCSNTTTTDSSDSTPSSGTKFTLYYGTDSCVTNLINQAKYTYMESGESVEQALSSIDLGSFLDLSSLEIAIKNKLATMKKGDILTGVFSTTQSFAPFNITGGQSIIIQSRGDNISTIGMIQVWNQLGYMHYGFCSNGTFTWKKPTLT